MSCSALKGFMTTYSSKLEQQASEAIGGQVRIQNFALRPVESDGLTLTESRFAGSEPKSQPPLVQG